jgi:hypothetical protein
MVEKEMGENGHEKCHLTCFLNFHGLLRNPLAVSVTKLLGGGRGEEGRDFCQKS